MSSFDGVTFGERGQGGTQFPIWQKRGTIVIKHISGSDKNVIQKIGVDLPRLSLPARVTATDLASLYGKVGASGSLVMGFETTIAYLESIEGEEISAGKDTYMVVLNFLRSAGGISTTPSNARITEAGDVRLTESGDTRITE